MTEYKHSVSLNVDRCKGCTSCLKRCPTEAIRIRDGHAVINSELCIDCGECIRVCEHKAKRAVLDTFADIDASKKWKIALPPPSIYGQFANLDDPAYILQGLLACGFDDVFEVARAAELVTEYTRNYLRDHQGDGPIINSACPVVVRLIRQRYPYLCEKLLPLQPPIEVASRMAKHEALRRHPELTEDDICTVFISPCPGKASYVKNGIEGSTGSVDYVISMWDTYLMLLDVMKREEIPEVSARTGMIGMSWASTGGESAALFNDQYLAADGIENVIKVLDEIEVGNLPDLEYIELNACNGGCVGGVLTPENPYIARVRLQSLRRYLPVSMNRLTKKEGEAQVPEHMQVPEPFTHRPVSRLSEDRAEAMQMMQNIMETAKNLPGKDCGCCGAPTCLAFAEDVVLGECDIDECIVRMRERIHKLAEEGGA